MITIIGIVFYELINSFFRIIIPVVIIIISSVLFLNNTSETICLCKDSYYLFIISLFLMILEPKISPKPNLIICQIPYHYIVHK